MKTSIDVNLRVINNIHITKIRIFGETRPGGPAWLFGTQSYTTFDTHIHIFGKYAYLTIDLANQAATQLNAMAYECTS